MQKLYVVPQVGADTQESVLFNVYENETVVDSSTGAERVSGTARIVFGYKTRKNNVFTKTSRSSVTRAIVNFPLDDVRNTSDVIEYLEDICDTSDLPANFFKNEDVISKYLDSDYKLKVAVPAKIFTQEFAFKLVRYQKGNSDVCAKSYADALKTNSKHTFTDSNGIERTVETPAFAVKLTKVLKRAVRKTDVKLLQKCSDSSGLFSATLMCSLPKESLSKVLKTADEILFGTAKNLDGILKRPRKGAPALQTVDGKYILSDNFFSDDEELFDTIPNILVEHDSENASFVKYQKDTRLASLVSSITEDDDEEETEEETEDATLEQGAE